jgi:hypothetical protein
MTDISINPYDIFIKFPKNYTRLSTLTNNLWNFDNPAFYKLVLIDLNIRYYQIGVPFGIVESKQNDPMKCSFFAEPGDFLAVTTNSELKIIPKDKFFLMFPMAETKP